MKIQRQRKCARAETEIVAAFGLRLCSILLTLSKVAAQITKTRRSSQTLYIYICINIKNVVKEEKDTSNLPRAMWAQRKLTLKRITACQRLVFCDQLSLSPFLPFSISPASFPTFSVRICESLTLCVDNNQLALPAIGPFVLAPWVLWLPLSSSLFPSAGEGRKSKILCNWDLVIISIVSFHTHSTFELRRNL